MLKKLFLSLVLLAGALVMPAQANSGCSLAVSTNPKITAQYGITVIVFSSTEVVTIAPGASRTVAVSDGDMVRVQASNYACGSLPELSWGYAIWTHCSEASSSAIVMQGSFTSDWYVARAVCMCPFPGAGYFTDLYSGQQCVPLVPPQQ